MPPADPPNSPVTRLQALLDLLFPELPLVDILTLTDFNNRYPFTRLGRRAVAAIEQAQRVTRASGDYRQMGLSEFYAGLIYLHEGQFLGAAHYFAEARRYWTFGEAETAACLTHLAQGIAQQGAFQYELALARYGQAERCLRRLLTNDLLGRNGLFVTDCRALLTDCREELARRLKAQAEGEEAEHEAQHVPIGPDRVTAADQSAETVAEMAAEVTPTQIQQPVTDTRPPADLPIFNLRPLTVLPEPYGEEEEEEGETTAVSPPSPIPDHQNNQPALIWYKTDPEQGFDVQTWLPGVPANAYVLVDTRIDHYFFQPGDLVIVNNDRADGKVPVRPEPLPAAPSPEPIYLGEIQKPPESDLVHDKSGTVNLEPDRETPLYAEDIIGMVIGVWVDFLLRRRPDAQTGSNPGG